MELIIGYLACIMICIFFVVDCMHTSEHKKIVYSKLNNIEHSIAEHHSKCLFTLSDTEKNIFPFVTNSESVLHRTDTSSSKPNRQQIRFQPYKKKLHAYRKKKFADYL